MVARSAQDSPAKLVSVEFGDEEMKSEFAATLKVLRLSPADFSSGRVCQTRPSVGHWRCPGLLEHIAGSLLPAFRAFANQGIIFSHSRKISRIADWKSS
jgi:hypothetical protein